MSLASIRNGVVTHMTASGPWAASEISTCSFSVLDAVSASAIVLQPGAESTIVPLTMNDSATVPGAYIRTWGMRGGVYIKDNGDAEWVLSKCWQAHDDLYNTFAKEDKAGGAAQLLYLSRVSFPEGSFESYGGALWAVVRFDLHAEEF